MTTWRPEFGDRDKPLAAANRRSRIRPYNHAELEPEKFLPARATPRSPSSSAFALRPGPRVPGCNRQAKTRETKELDDVLEFRAGREVLAARSKRMHKDASHAKAVHADPITE